MEIHNILTKKNYFQTAYNFLVPQPKATNCENSTHGAISSFGVPQFPLPAPSRLTSFLHSKKIILEPHKYRTMTSYKKRNNTSIKCHKQLNI